MSKLGQRGEAMVAKNYESRGFQVIERNWHSRFGEIDLIVQDFHWLVFVEVKTRSSKAFGEAYEAVTASKQEKLRTTAEIYLAEHPTALQPRFDVVSVYPRKEGDRVLPVIEIIENAF